MPRIPRRLTIFLVLLVVAVLGYVASGFVSSVEVPAGFSESRLQGALIAQQIVDLSNQSATDIEKINKLHREDQFQAALTLAAGAVERSRQVRDQAVLLSNELEKMTRALSTVDSFEARQTALEAVSDRLALINRLINYTTYMSQVLEVLQGVFEGNTVGIGRVGLLIDQINVEIKEINKLNTEAGEAMKRFDRIVGK